jgi:predicted nuclease of predicted toxin-antitoxin system
MKVLLDECLPLDFRHSFPTIQVHTAQWAGFKGKKNGELLEAAEAAGYDVLLTVDQGIPHQHRRGDRRLAVVVLHSSTNQLQDLLPLVDRIVQVLANIQPGETVAVPSSD